MNKSPAPDLITPIVLSMILLIPLWSLLAHAGSALPGTPEQGAEALWHLWWPAVSLSSPDGAAIHAYLGGPYLANHLSNAPILLSFVYHGLEILTSNPVLAFNLSLTLSLIATALSAYALLRLRAIPAPLAGVLAGLFGLSGWTMAAVQGAQVIPLSMWVVMLTLLAWHRWEATRRPLWLTLAAGSVLFWALAGLQIAIIGVLLTVPYVSLRLSDLPDRANHRQELQVAALLALIIVLIYPVPVVLRVLQGQEPAFVPAAFSRMGGPGIIDLIAGHLPLILLAGLLLVRAAGRGLPSRTVFWLVGAGAALLMALGIMGSPVQLVLALLNIDSPSTLIANDYFALVMAFALLMALVEAWTPDLLDGLQGRVQAGLAAGLIVMAMAVNFGALRGMTVHIVQSYPFYATLESDPEDYYVLAYPAGLTSTLSDDQAGAGGVLARYAAWHGKRSVNGIAPYYAPGMVNAYRSMGFFDPLLLDEGGREAAINALDEAIRTWRIGVVVVHPDLMTAGELATTEALLTGSTALCSPVQVDGLLVYRALWHPAGCED